MVLYWRFSNDKAKVNVFANYCSHESVSQFIGFVFVNPKKIIRLDGFVYSRDLRDPSII